MNISTECLLICESLFMNEEGTCKLHNNRRNHKEKVKKTDLKRMKGNNMCFEVVKLRSLNKYKI